MLEKNKDLFTINLIKEEIGFNSSDIEFDVILSSDYDFTLIEIKFQEYIRRNGP